jgi:DNA-binding transcriptional MerR regulator
MKTAILYHKLAYRQLSPERAVIGFWCVFFSSNDHCNPYRALYSEFCGHPYFEQEGLLPEPTRSGGNYRLYSDIHLERLQFIRHCRSLDMTLEEIRDLLRFRDAPDENCSEVNALLDEHIEHVAKRIKQLKLLQKNLRGLRNLCRQTLAMEHSIKRGKTSNVNIVELIIPPIATVAKGF